MIGLVACSKTKLDRAAPARELYTSPLFRLSLAYASARCRVVYVASAKHGLVELDQALAPYDLTLADLPFTEALAWGREVARALFKLHGTDIASGEAVLALAGERYIGPIAGAYHAGYGRLSFVEPLRAMQIGQRLSFLSRELARTEAA